MQNLIKQRPYRLAVQNNKKNLQDFDITLELPARAFAKIFWGERKNALLAYFSFVSAQDTIILRGSTRMPPEKFYQITLKYTRFQCFLEPLYSNFCLKFVNLCRSHVLEIINRLRFHLYSGHGAAAQQAFQRAH